MKAYQFNTYSGHDWFGDIPSHWSFLLVRRLVDEHKQGFYTSQDYVDNGTKLLRITDIDDFSNVDFSKCPQVELSENEKQSFGLKAGDFVFARSGSIGRFGIIRENNDAVFASYLIRFRFSDKATTEFLKFYFLSNIFRNLLISDLHGGANQNIHAENIKNQFLALPPLHEQGAIADFLDRKTAQIDALIAKKQRQVDLLHEQRTALINQAVTKGLWGLGGDAMHLQGASHLKPEMKDSGVEWLGEIPSHWEVLSLKRVITKFVDYRGRTPPKTDFGVLLITAKNIRDGHLDFETSKEYIAEDFYDEWMVRGFPEKGDVLVTTEAPLGATAQIEAEYVALAQRLILLKANKTKIDNTYLKYYFLSQFGQHELLSRSTGSTALGIKASKFKNINIVVPSLTEQKEIADFLSTQGKTIRMAIRKIQSELDKLKEYRTALISAAVTGKIDVRG